MEYLVLSGNFYVEEIPCIQEQKEDTNGKGIEEVIRNSSKRYWTEKQLMARFIQIMETANLKLEQAKEKTKKADWLKNKLFLDIDLEVKQENMVNWMEERLTEVEDAVIFF